MVRNGSSYVSCHSVMLPITIHNAMELYKLVASYLFIVTSVASLCDM